MLVFPDGTGPALLSSLIAGLPLNKVHKLNFAPGEIFFDANHESCLTRSSHVDTIEKEKLSLDEEYGRVALEHLRDEELTEMIPQVASVPKQNESKAFQKEFDEVRVNSVERISPEIKHNKLDMKGLLLFCLMGIGGASLISADSKEQVKFITDSRTTMKSNFHENLGRGNISKIEETKIDSKVSSLETFPELKELESKVMNGAFDIPEMENAEQKENIAKAAMETYMNKDDGSEEFINFISELTNEQ